MHAFRFPLLAAIILALLPLGGTTVFAYEYFGESNGAHPYDTRWDMYQRMKERMKEREKNVHITAAQEYYYHPGWARSSELHPYYRNGLGINNTTSVSNFERWSRRQDPFLNHTRWTGAESFNAYGTSETNYQSPVLGCRNYNYERPHYRSKPFAYECW